MALSRLFEILSLLFSLAATTFAVDITIGYQNSRPGRSPQAQFLQFKCPNIRPGYCCALPRLTSVFTTWELDLTAAVKFERLVVTDIAAIFGVIYPNEQNADNNGCLGQIGPTRQGPGTWSWRNPDRNQRRGLAARGASYISLPRRLPPDGLANKWMALEGILGLVWGDGKWFSNTAAERRFGMDPSASGSWISPKSQLKRDIRSARDGKIYARPPSQWVYPSLIEVNGKIYTNNGAGVPIYLDATGEVLNLTNVGQWMGPL
ncbi:MAG: hypothetical protein Q9202_005276 [Teloschistes flavicans]